MTKLNDGAATKVDTPPPNKTYYKVGDECFVKAYARGSAWATHGAACAACWPTSHSLARVVDPKRRRPRGAGRRVCLRRATGSP